MIVVISTLAFKLENIDKKVKKMARIYSGDLLSITGKEFEQFLNQYLYSSWHEKIELIDKVKRLWIEQVESSSDRLFSDIPLPSTKGELTRLYPNGVGAYSIFVKHPDVKYSDWFCFYVGISGTSISGRVAKHHCEDIRRHSRFKWLAECTATFSCFLSITHDSVTKENLELLEYCLTGELRPWMRAVKYPVLHHKIFG